MSVGFEEFDQFFAKGEKLLNIPGYIPFIGMISGTIRATAGKIMAVVSLITAIGFLIANCFNKSANYGKMASHCFTYVLHGIADVMRGVVEAIPFLNLILIPYDLSTRYTYPAEVIKINVPANQIPALKNLRPAAAAG